MTPPAPITLADEAEEQWLANTRRLLEVARNEPNKFLRQTAMARAKLRVDSARFTRLPESTQQDLLEMYAQAFVATGAMFP